MSKSFETGRSGTGISEEIAKAAMSSTPKGLYEFGPFRLDLERHLLSRAGQSLPLPPKAFELLLVLVQSPGRAFSKRELMTAVWADTFVEEANLSFQISVLRKALGGDAAWIETIPKHGYRFSAEVGSASTANTLPVQEPTERQPIRGVTNARTWQVGTAIGFAALLALGWYRPFGSNDAATTIRAGMVVPLTAYPGFEQAPSLSPDGSQVAFSWNGPRQDNYDIYVKLVGPGEPVQLTQNAAPEENPAWSPNGDRIAFLRRASENSAELFTIPALRGAEHRIATISPEYARNRPFNNLSWTPDGKWLAFGGALSPDGARGIWLVAADGGETRRLTKAPIGGVGDVNPVWSSDGRQMAFLREQTINGAAVFVLPLTFDWKPDGPPRQVSSESWGVQALAWLPDARGLLFSWGGHGAPTRLRETSLSPGSGGIAASEFLPFGDQAAALSISRTGRVVYSAYSRDVELFEIPLSGTSHAKVPAGFSSTFDEHTPDYSPDGARVAFASTRSGAEEIWIANRDGTNALKMTSVGGRQCSNPRWSPNGLTIVFNSRREGTADLYVLQPDSGEVHRITEGPAEEIEPRWSRDGRWIYFGSNRTGRYEVWRMPSAGGAATRITLQGGLTATESPDGRFLYYAKQPLSPTTIWRVPVGGGEETQVVDSLSYSLNFVVADRGLYFVAVGSAPEQTSIDFFDFSTNQRTTLANLGKRWFYGMALSPHQDSLLVSLVDSAGANLMVVDNLQTR